IVCGASNMKVGDKVPTALVGGTLPGGFKIGKRKMRGVESQGMMCSARELGLGEDHEGLLILEGEFTVGEDVKAPLGLDEVVLEIEVTPNRGDWAGLIGIARELAAAYGLSLRVPDVSLQENAQNASDTSSVTIDDPDLCPRYIGRLLSGVTVGPSPQWMAQRLIAAGQRPINNIVDVTNYVLLETGQPLHAFDTEKLQEGRIVVRRAKDGETITVIDQTEHKLTDEMLVIADAKDPVAVAGVMGGFGTEVGEGTTEIFLESAYFDPVSVRRTARALNMITEASQRFQRGADPEMADYASRRAAQLLCEVAGGELYGGALDAYPKPLEQKAIVLRFDRTNALLGSDVPPETQQKCLESLGFGVASSKGGSATFTVPTWRHDASHEADLIEEVARLHGYDNIGSTLPKVRCIEEVYAPEQGPLRTMKNYLTRAGLSEIVNWTFLEIEDLRRAGLESQISEAIRLENPLSEKHAIMRTTLIPALLHTTSDNLRKNRNNVRVFEMGPVYTSDESETSARQRPRLGIAMAGESVEKHWSRPRHAVDLYDLKGYVEGLLSLMGATDTAFQAVDHPTFAPGSAAEILLHGNAIGVIGRVDQDVLSAFDVEQPVLLAELELGSLLKLSKGAAQFSDIPAHPPSLRDIAVVVDAATPAGELQAAAQRAGGKLLQDVALFDIYTGKPVPEGKKSVALSLRFQSHERTLTDKDTEKAWSKILKALEKQFNAELR
ncbi:MAG: phenylalanine--tRNA ligase subunit beta, partial [Candidatus Hydrogenedentes bacterium]|nr:phenylalanine--tRNA ligase subunit beta [Candidatus Hydrogenedentota bacterium]